jgi:hypothetical protein
MIAAAFLSLLLQAAAPAASKPATADRPAVQGHNLTLYNFFRAQVFHDMAVRADCLRVAPERTRDLNARFEAARTRLAALVGPGIVDQPMGGRADDGGGCESGGLLFGYEDKVVGLERNLADGAP